MAKLIKKVIAVLKIIVPLTGVTIKNIKTALAEIDKEHNKKK